MVTSPRAASPLFDTSGYSISSHQKKVSQSLAFNPGALKDSSSIVDRLSNHNRKNFLYCSYLIAGIKVHKGPFHMNSVSSKNPKYLISELNKLAEQNKIYYRNVRNFFLFFDKNCKPLISLTTFFELKHDFFSPIKLLD
jgi:hypothetical protein